MKRGLGNLVRAGVDLAVAAGIALAAAVGGADGQVVAAVAGLAAVETGAGNLAGKTSLVKPRW